MSQQLNSKNTGTVVLLFMTSLVPRRSLLPRCLREVWERAGERARSRQVSLGDVTAHGRVHD